MEKSLHLNAKTTIFCRSTIVPFSLGQEINLLNKEMKAVLGIFILAKFIQTIIKNLYYEK